MHSVPEPAAETTKSRLVSAAFALFAERGFDGTTTDDIAQRAGVGRTTFFRTFRTKEDVIFPAHEDLLERIGARLAVATPRTRDVALTEAAGIVLRHYLAEGELARARYRLVSSVPVLRAREVAGIQQYQRLFAASLTDWMAGEPDGELRAGLVAAAVVTAHNYVLRRWLRGETDTPEADFERSMEVALRQFRESPVGGEETAVVVLRTTAGLEDVVTRLRPLLEHRDEATER
ncbi:TetR family transcriptional regulator [Nocardioides gansuensis]|uniref:TetR family transcriptional regulator n=1 Tax=Nocardioides gansuensis TaxID=2138300 RepID=A0A2T8FE70_9ACTN|nr:TetR family transcriptional regulator [Nocardioides gansuensis]